MFKHILFDSFLMAITKFPFPCLLGSKYILLVMRIRHIKYKAEIKKLYFPDFTEENEVKSQIK